METKLSEEIKAKFPPEFINRIDQIIVFDQLNPDQVEKIVGFQLQPLAGKLAEQNLNLEVTPAAKKYLAQNGFDAEYGARPLKRLIQAKIVKWWLISIIRSVG
jgi:ATP-dependent Clp protease ATP-binding subunit ClpA